jgi:DNA polymerase-3 subunit delta'
MNAETVQTTGAPFPGYIGQAHAVDLLVSAVRGGRLGHAYLFTGPDGVGKEPLALALAKAVNCPNSQPDGALYCGECPVCRRIDRFDYPDALYLFPMPGDTNAEYGYDPAEAAARMDEKRADPHRPITFERNVQILIGQIRELGTIAARNPLEGKLRVAIVSRAHLMNIYTANAFLKLLEEPPERTIFVLCTTQPHRLPATIISRCHIVRLGRLRDDEVEQVLGKVTDLDRDSVSRAVSLGSGSAGRALEMSGDDFQDLEVLAAALVKLASLDDRSLVEAAGELARAADREKLLKALELLCILHYGKALEEAGESPFIRSPEGLLSEPGGLRLDGGGAIQACAYTEEAKQALQANVNLSLLILRWALAVRRLAANKR